MAATRSAGRNRAAARSVSAARIAPPLMRKNPASPICRPDRPLFSTAGPPLATTEGGAADDHRHDRIELEAKAGGGRRRAQPAERDDHAGRREAAHPEKEL